MMRLARITNGIGNISLLTGFLGAGLIAPMRTQNHISPLPFKQLTALAFLFSTTLTSPAQFLFNAVSPSYPGIIGTNLTSGASFTVGSQPILVTALGIYDDQLDGFGASYRVGVWGSGGLVVSALVPAGTSATLQDNFRYVSIAPLQLSANTTYRIGSNVGLNDAFPFDLIGLEGSASIGSAFSGADPQMFSGYNTGFADPALIHPSSQNLWSANLQYVAVPEPTSLALILTGAVAVFSRVRIKQ